MLNTQAASEWWQPFVKYTGSEKPSQFARVLAENLPFETEGSLLDVGCGCGPVGIYGLENKRVRSVTFNDLQPQWIETTRRNVEIKIREGAFRPDQVSFTTPCSFRKIPEEVIARQTLLAFNPPQLPASYVDTAILREIASDTIQSTFRIGGLDGLDIVRDFLEWYADLAMPKPYAVINLSAFLGKSLIAHTIASCGLREVSRKETRIALRSLFAKEKISELSAAEIKDRSLEPDGSGWWTKNLLTLRIINR